MVEGEAVLVAPDGRPLRTLGNGNGHSDETHDAVMRAAASMLIERMQFANQHGLSFNGARDFYVQFGYDRTISSRQYYETYRRGGIAGRIVDAYPNACWRGGVEIIEDEDPKKVTPFEQAFLDLDKRLKIWVNFRQVDLLSQLGQYAILLLGAGPNDFNAPLGTAKTPDALWYVQPYAESDVVVTEWEDDARSPRFGLPRFYQFMRTTGTIGSGNVALAIGNRQIAASSTAFNPVGLQKPVHWTRVIHVAEGCLDNNVYGQPRLERIWNDLLDLMKVRGGGAEAFWLRANQGIALNISEKMKLTPEQRATFTAALLTQIDEYQHQIRRAFTTHGVDLTTLGSDVAQFNSAVDCIITLIAGSVGIPKRILTGSEMGQLASSQDQENWTDQVNGRQTQHCEPNIIRAFVDRCIEFGFLPAPADDYQVRWARLQRHTDAEKVTIATGMAAANSQYAASSNGRILFTDAEIRDHTFQWEPLTDADRENAKDEAPEPPPQLQPGADQAGATAGGEGSPEAAGAGDGADTEVPEATRRAAQAFSALVADLEAAIQGNDIEKVGRLMAGLEA